ADIVPLPVLRGGVVDLEEELEQLAEAGDRRIENDLDGLRVGAVVAVGGVRDVAAGIADTAGNDAGLAPDQVLRAPEAAACQNRAFGRSHGVLRSPWIVPLISGGSVSFASGAGCH